LGALPQVLIGPISEASGPPFCKNPTPRASRKTAHLGYPLICRSWRSPVSRLIDYRMGTSPIESSCRVSPLFASGNTRIQFLSSPPAMFMPTGPKTFVKYKSRLTVGPWIRFILMPESRTTWPAGVRITTFAGSTAASSIDLPAFLMVTRIALGRLGALSKLPHPRTVAVVPLRILNVSKSFGSGRISQSDSTESSSALTSIKSVDPGLFRDQIRINNTKDALWYRWGRLRVRSFIPILLLSVSAGLLQ
jgi:hypothetical protein